MSLVMKRVVVSLTVICGLVLISVVHKLETDNSQSGVIPLFDINLNGSITYGKLVENSIKIAVTCCVKDYGVIEQTAVMMKSALIFSRSHIHFIIIADEKARIELPKKILEWPKPILSKISVEMLSPSFPDVTEPEKWRKAFKQCSSQRLFFPLLLPHHDSVLHIDGDVVFLTAVDQLWNYFDSMTDQQIGALASENMNPKTNWYIYHNKTAAPFATKFALNAGIMPMNLTRMRQLNFFDEVKSIVEKYKDRLPWFDQDVLNVYFHDHPDRLLFLPCRWNYLRDHCSDGNLCPSAETEGVAILHGSRSSFHYGYTNFRAVYRAFNEYNFETNLATNLLLPMRKILNRFGDNKCTNGTEIFTKTIEQFIQRL